MTVRRDKIAALSETVNALHGEALRDLSGRTLFLQRDRWPKARGRKLRPPPEAAHPVIHFIINEMVRRRIQKRDLLKRAGVSACAFNQWRGLDTGRPSSPGLHCVEAALNALGYRLTVERIEK